MEFVIEVATRPDEFFNLTGKIMKLVEASRVDNGLCTVFCRHTSCCLLVQENDSMLLDDFREFMEKISPLEGRYHHEENAPSHIRAGIIGCDRTIPIKDGKLRLGEWQNILLYECDVRERKRDIIVKIMES